MLSHWLSFTSLLALSRIVSSDYPCDEDFSVEIEPYLEYPDGSLWDVKGASAYPNGTYWKEDKGGKETVRGCPCLLQRPCLRKCCPFGVAADSEGHCVEDVRGNVLLLNVSDDDGTNPRIVDGNVQFGLLFGVVRDCERKFFLDPVTVLGDGYFLRASDGMIVLYERNLTYGPYIFCYDFVPELEDYRPFVCEPPLGIDRLAAKLYPFTLLASAVFLLLAFLVYAIIPELRNLHGNILMCHMFSLFVAFLFFSLTAFVGRRISYGACVAVAFIIEFSLIATFFWLNVMCFDICITFRNIRPTHSSTCSKKDGKKFLLYSLYAWGSPTIVLIVTVIMQFSPGLPDDVIRPEFGKIKCYFHSYESLAAYLYAPITTLLVSNIIMFIITAVNICKLNKETAILKSGGSRRHASPFVDYNKQRFILYVKLFIVMGITWMMDFVAWVIGAPTYYFYLTEIWNSLQGLFIFIVFVWKKSVRRMLQQRFCPKMSQHVENLRDFCGSLMPCFRNSVATQDESCASTRNTTTSFLSSNPNEESDKRNNSSLRPVPSSLEAS